MEESLESLSTDELHKRLDALVPFANVLERAGKERRLHAMCLEAWRYHREGDHDGAMGCEEEALALWPEVFGSLAPDIDDAHLVEKVMACPVLFEDLVPSDVIEKLAREFPDMPHDELRRRALETMMQNPLMRALAVGWLG